MSQDFDYDQSTPINASLENEKEKQRREKYEERMKQFPPQMQVVVDTIKNATPEGQVPALPRVSELPQPSPLNGEKVKKVWGENPSQIILPSPPQHQQLIAAKPLPLGMQDDEKEIVELYRAALTLGLEAMMVKQVIISTIRNLLQPPPTTKKRKTKKKKLVISS